MSSQMPHSLAMQKQPSHGLASTATPLNTISRSPGFHVQENSPLKKLVNEVLEAHRTEDPEEPKGLWASLRERSRRIVEAQWFEYVTGAVILLNMITIYVEVDASIQTGESPWPPWAITDIVSSRWFEYLTGFIILLNMVTIGLDAELSLHADIPGAYDTEWIKNIERGFLAVYTVELVLRLVGGGVRILTSSWFLLDAFLVTVGLLALVIVPIVGSAEQDAALSGIEKILVVRGLRLLRLVRALRMISHFKVMWRLVYSLLTAGQTMLSATALIMLSLFIFGCVSIEMIHSEPDLLKTEETATIVREHFGSLQRAIITLIQFVTLDSIAAIYYPLVQAKPYLLVIFAPMLIVISVGLMNLVTAVLVENALEVSANEQEEERNQLKKKVKRALPTLIATFNHLDRDESGSITREEIENVPIEILPSKVLENVSIDNMVDLFEMLDVEGNGRLELDEFIGGLLNLVLLDVPLWSIQSQRMLGSIRATVTSLDRDIAVIRCKLNRLTGSLNDGTLGMDDSV